MKNFVIVSFAMALGVASCQKKTESTSTSLIDTNSAPSAAVAINASGTPSESPAVPVEEDFEQKAEATISASNVEQELQKLKQEIGQ